MDRQSLKVLLSSLVEGALLERSCACLEGGVELWRRGVRGLRSGWASKIKQAKHFSLRIDGSLDLEWVYSPSANRERDDEKVLLLSRMSRDLDESRATADDRRLDDLAATAQARRNDRERTADDMRSALVASRREKVV